MAEQHTGEAAPTASAATTTGAGAGSQGRAGMTDEQVAGLTGHVPDPPTPTPSDKATAGGPGEGQPTAGVSDITPGQQGAGAEAAKPGEGEGAKPEPQPGDEVLATLAGLEEVKPGEPLKPGETETKGVPTIEELQKEINPDGAATPEQQLAKSNEILLRERGEKGEAQKLIGRQGQELGEFRKVFKDLGETVFDFGPDGKGRFNLQKISATMGEVEVERQLREAGYRLVPLDGAGAGEPDEAAIINTLIPDKDLGVDEKWAAIQGDPKLMRAFAKAVAGAEMARERQAGETAIKSAQQRAGLEAETKAAVAELKKLPHYEAELKPRMVKWNARLPETGEGALTGALRVQVVRMLAEAERMPGVVRAVRDAALAAGEQTGLRKMGMVLPVGGPGASGRGAPGMSDDQVEALTGHRPERAGG